MTEGKKGFSQILGETWNLFQRNWIPLCFIVIIANLPLMIFQLFAGKSLVLMGLYFVVSMVSMCFWQISSVRAIDLAEQGVKFSPFSMYRQATSSFWPFCWVSLIVLVKILLWTLLLIIPGIVFSIFYSFSIYALLLDGQKGMAALIRSKKIVKPNFWRFVGYNLLMGLILIFVYFIVALLSSPLMIVGAIFKVPATSFLATLAMSVSMVLGSLFMSVITVFWIVFIFKLYRQFNSELQQITAA